MSNIKVSAIVSTYKSEEFIEGCLKDLVQQSLYKKGELEIIIIDSSSPENEGEIVRKFLESYSNIHYERTEIRETLYRAWNRAIEKAKGIYITNANTDDRRRSDAIEIMADYLDRHPDISLVYGDQLITTVKNETFDNTGSSRRWHWPEYSLERLRQGCCVGSQPMWRRHLHAKYGYFQEEFSCAGDYDFWLRIGSAGERMALIPDILGLYYLNQRGLEHGSSGKALEEHFRVCRAYNIPYSVPDLDSLESIEIDVRLLGSELDDGELDRLNIIRSLLKIDRPRIVIDGVIFQINRGGIYRVWYSLLKCWQEMKLNYEVIILDRDFTAPRFEGFHYWNIESYDYNRSGEDAFNLQSICDRLRADLFLSTYYTTPLSTPSLVLVHDMIPEVMGADLTHPEWREKNHALLYASRYISISENTSRDLRKFYPEISPDRLNIVYNGVDSSFSPAPESEIKDFLVKYNISKPYFLLVGSRVSLKGYKNTKVFFEALAGYGGKESIEVVCVGHDTGLEPELVTLTAGVRVHLLELDDRELIRAYSGAIALVYPSLYEGFGLPVLEAMACGCPAITCKNSAIVEVAGDSALYIDGKDTGEMLRAIEEVQNPEYSSLLVQRGLARASRFSWEKMAGEIGAIIERTIEQKSSLPDNGKLWRQLRELQVRNQRLKKKERLDSDRISSLKGSLHSLTIQNESLLETVAELQETIDYISTGRSAVKILAKSTLIRLGLFRHN